MTKRTDQRNRLTWMLSGAALGAFLFAGPTNLPAGETPGAKQTQTEKETKQQAKKNKKQRTKEGKTANRNDTVQLGVMVAASPGPGMLVLRVKSGSAADEAGIQPGDYILKVGGKKLASPKALQKRIASHQSGDTAEILIWRDGDEQTVKASFQPSGKTQQRYFRGSDGGEDLEKHAWLGLLMNSSDEEGVQVSRVYVQSPAAKAGVKEGDRIVKVGKHQIDKPGDVSEAIKEMEPGDEVDIVVERDGEEKDLSATIGNLGDFHEQLFGEKFRRKFIGFHQLLDPDFDGIPEIERLRIYIRTPDDAKKDSSEKENSGSDEEKPKKFDTEKSTNKSKNDE